ncbi:unnamed protein product [Moneuplotes crassus]|uniref:Uncharacterized protein n=1 Tax=Euplotes crassus TaxID=5936 RepID=A0AAD1X7B3_EUPCR|nr:unnamed protein product [Moneuplotes crassus]
MSLLDNMLQLYTLEISSLISGQVNEKSLHKNNYKYSLKLREWCRKRNRRLSHHACVHKPQSHC